jgi:hypothetical protein
MFTANDLLGLLHARPFVPFRFLLSDGGTVEVRSPELVSVGKRYAFVGLLDPESNDTLPDRWTFVWYMHVARVESVAAGPRPLAPPGDTSGSPQPSPA